MQDMTNALKRMIFIVAATFMACSCRNCPSIEKTEREHLSFGAKCWIGGRVERRPVKTGARSLRWAHGESGEIVLPFDPPEDWSQFSGLSFDLRSEKATGSEFLLILSSDNPDTDGSDYYFLRIKLDWTGWRHFIVPFDELGATREPVGLSKIDSVRFNANGWGNTAHPEAVLHLDGFSCEKETELRTRMTDEDFFERLDLEVPELEAVRTAVEAKDYPAARVALAKHLRNRSRPRWFIDWREHFKHRRERGEEAEQPQVDKNVIRSADKAVAKTFSRTYDNRPWTVTFEGTIDWAANPTKGDARAADWNTVLNRHYHFDSLSSAYWQTGEEKYSDALAEQWLDWIESNPPPLVSWGNSPSDGNYAWQTLTTGIRLMDCWPNSLYRCMSSPAFDDELLVEIMKSVGEQAEHLMKWPTKANWLTMESMGLYTSGMLYPEFRAASSWRTTAVDRLYEQLDEEVYPDGMEYELAFGYNRIVLGIMLGLMERADLNGLTDEVPKDFCDRLEKMCDYCILAMQPDGKIPGLNDSSTSQVRTTLARAVPFFPEREDFLFGATGGREGKPPKVSSVAFPYTGHYVMRSGWDLDSLHLLFDSGLLGRAHYHEDKLHFTLWAYGKQHVLDPGNLGYDQSKWRRYIRSTAAHNTVLVDGQGQNRSQDPKNRIWPKPWDQPVPPQNDTVWMSNDDLDFVRGTYRKGYGPDLIDVTHTRRILFAKPEYFVVLDILDPADDKEHTYELLFHLDAESVTAESFYVRTEDPDSSNLAIVPLVEQGLGLEIVRGREDPVQGWASGPWRPIPTAVFSQTGTGRTTFVTVLYPTRAGEVSPIASVASSYLELGYEVIFEDGRRDRIVFHESGSYECSLQRRLAP